VNPLSPNVCRVRLTAAVLQIHLQEITLEVVRSQVSGGVGFAAHFRPECGDFSRQRSGTRVANIVGMNTAHEKALKHELRLARELMDRGNFDDAFVHLERAHILGQASVRWHVLAHWLMFKVAIRRHQGIAALGQAVRIVLGAIGSAVGRVPTGNTGGSD
jgi:Protein of unknown function (DUF3703)